MKKKQKGVLFIKHRVVTNGVSENRIYRIYL